MTKTGKLYEVRVANYNGIRKEQVRSRRRTLTGAFRSLAGSIYDRKRNNCAALNASFWIVGPDGHRWTWDRDQNGRVIFLGSVRSGAD